MGNTGSSGNHVGRRRNRNRNRRHHPANPPPHPGISPNHYVFAAATPYPTQYPNPNAPHPQQLQYPGYYPPPPHTMPMPLPVPYDHHHRGVGHMDLGNWARYGPMIPPPLPYVEHQKAVTIRNDVNLKKESLRLQPDEENPGKFLVTFTFDATVSGSITVMFFAKEGDDCNLIPTKENILAPVIVHFEQGLGQKFRQPAGTGIDFSVFDESELLKDGDVDIYPLAIKAEASPVNQNNSESEQNSVSGTTNSQITQAVFGKEKGVYQLKVMKQILWVNGMRYELQEIYGIGNSVDGDVDANDPGKECVICLSEPCNTTVLPCRHMCMCSGCAKVLRFQTNRCPICRQPVERLLEIKVNNRTDE